MRDTPTRVRDLPGAVELAAGWSHTCARLVDGSVRCWGSGTDGTYAVYRDAVPGFTPSGANLVTSGLTGLSYNDVGAPNDQTLYYVVLAESDG